NSEDSSAAARSTFFSLPVVADTETSEVAIMSTSISWRANAAKIRARKPGPEVMRGLDALTISWRRLKAIDFKIGEPLAAFGGCATIAVPGCSGLNVFSTRTGMSLAIAGTK